MAPHAQVAPMRAPGDDSVAAPTGGSGPSAIGQKGDPPDSSSAPTWVPRSAPRVVARAKHSLVILDPQDVWAFEARERLCFVHSRFGRFDVETSLLAVEQFFGAQFVRVHRGWLANVARVLELVAGGASAHVWVGCWSGGEHQKIRVPLSRGYTGPLRERLLAGSIGMRSKRPRSQQRPEGGSPTVDLPKAYREQGPQGTSHAAQIKSSQSIGRLRLLKSRRGDP